jgi:hypothetical protein
MQSDLEYFIAFVSKFRNILFRYPLLKLIVSSSENLTIIAFELLIIEFMERSTSSKIVLNLILQYGNWLHFFLFKTAMYSFSVCLKPSVEDFRSEINCF